MATLANLVVRITGNTAQLNKAVDKAETRMGKFKKGASKALNAVKTAAKGLAIGGAVAVAGFAVASIKSFLDVGEALDKMSKRTGVSVEALGELKFAAEQSGSSIETIEKAMTRSAGVILDANNGLAGAKDALDQLGLSAQALAAMSPEEQFNTLAAALAGVESASERAALAQDVFGKSGTELLPLFAEGAAGMDALRAQAQSLGIVMSGEAAAGAASFNDSMNELKSAAFGVFRGIAGELLPKLAEFARWLVSKKPEIVAFFTGVKEGAAPFFEAFKVGVSTIMPVLQGFFAFIFNNKPLLIASIAAVGVAIATALGPASLAILAITGIITVIGLVKQNWDTIWGAMRDTLSAVWTAIQTAISTPLMAIQTAVSAAWTAIQTAISTALTAIQTAVSAAWTAIQTAVSTALTAIQTAISTAWAAIQTAISTALTAIQTNVSTVWTAISNFISTMLGEIAGFFSAHWQAILAILFPPIGLPFLVTKHWGPIKGVVSGILTAVFGFFTSLWSNVTGWFTEIDLPGHFQKMWGGVAGIVGGIFDDVQGRVKAAVNGMVGIINSFIGSVNRIQITVPSVDIPLVGTVGGFSIGMPQIPTIPTLAAGGNILRGGTALVGEEGPELLRLPRGAQVSPLDGSGGGMGGDVNFYFPNYVGNRDDLKRIINEARLEFERRGN